MKLKERLIMVELETDTKEEAITMLGNQLYECGYVKDDFVESVLKREKEFPTGLATSPFGVAIPHTDGDKVIESQVAFASLKEPVKFHAMGSLNEEIDVKLIFMLALNDPMEQLEMLQKLTGMFQDEEMVSRLGKIQDTNEFNELIESLG
ncbi:PTS sugar transporter subunit IIA [Oceanobacillus profundus]|uniref:PTS sugar transporter subunit IIA n=1 Tax=Oceanobacillus profundus TaxID=372463 RepID=UPI0036364E71